MFCLIVLLIIDLSNAQDRIAAVRIDKELPVILGDINRFRASLDATAMNKIGWLPHLANESYRDAEVLLSYFKCSNALWKCQNKPCNDNFVNLLLKQETLFHVNLGISRHANIEQGIGRMFAFLGNRNIDNCAGKLDITAASTSMCSNNRYKIFDGTDAVGCSLVSCKIDNYEDYYHLVCKFRAKRKARATHGEVKLYESASDKVETCSKCSEKGRICVKELCVAVSTANHLLFKLTILICLCGSYFQL